MDGKFLHKVVDQIVSETDIFEDRGHIFINYPFSKYGGININLPAPSKDLKKHCMEVYGLNHREYLHVWDQYKSTLKKYHRGNNFGGKLDL